MKRIYLIDCPGIVPTSSHDSTTSTVLKGVIRVENLHTPSEHIPTLLSRVRPEYLSRTYGIPVPESGSWEAEDFLELLARKTGRLLKKGEADIETVAKMVLNDWIRGKIPFFVRPPDKPLEKGKEKAKESWKEKEKRGEVKGVEQPLKQIVVMTKFLEDDAKGDGDDDEEEWGGIGSVDNNDAEQSEDGEMEGIDEEESVEEPQDEEELAWEDVFGAIANNGDDGERTQASSSRVSEAKVFFSACQFRLFLITTLIHTAQSTFRRGFRFGRFSTT
jgi:nuclear GTP-binding protein